MNVNYNKRKLCSFNIYYVDPIVCTKKLSTFSSLPKKETIKTLKHIAFMVEVISFGNHMWFWSVIWMQYCPGYIRCFELVQIEYTECAMYVVHMTLCWVIHCVQGTEHTGQQNSQCSLVHNPKVLIMLNMIINLSLIVFERKNLSDKWFACIVTKNQFRKPFVTFILIIAQNCILYLYALLMHNEHMYYKHTGLIS